jgi:hypothetical protein
MSVDANVTTDGATLTVSLPIRFTKRGGRKVVVTPEGQSARSFSRARIDSALVKAIARAHRWQRMLEDGTYSSIAELAAAERINPSYLARVLRLTLLAPDLVEDLLDGRHDPKHSLHGLTKPFPLEWEAQRTCT